MEYPKAFNCLTRVQFHSNQGRSNDLDERVQGKFLKGSFLGSKMDSFFGDGVGGLPCSQPLLPISVLVCVISCSSGLGQRDLRRLLGDFKTAPPRRHRIQHFEGPVLAPCIKQTCTRKGQKVDPLEIKSGSIWRVQLWPLHLGTFVAKSPSHTCGKL